jgi:hypothetical protein
VRCRSPPEFPFRFIWVLGWSTWYLCANDPTPCTCNTNYLHILTRCHSCVGWGRAGGLGRAEPSGANTAVSAGFASGVSLQRMERSQRCLFLTWTRSLIYCRLPTGPPTEWPPPEGTGLAGHSQVLGFAMRTASLLLDNAPRARFDFPLEKPHRHCPPLGGGRRAFACSSSCSSRLFSPPMASCPAPGV